MGERVLIVHPFTEGKGITEKGQANGLRSLREQDFISILVQVERKGETPEPDRIGKVRDFVLRSEITPRIAIVLKANAGGWFVEVTNFIEINMFYFVKLTDVDTFQNNFVYRQKFINV